MNILKKSLLSASVALALGGAGVAPETQAIQVAANGVGQVLLAPVYYAREGEKTKLTIVNTSMTHAAKVKAVFRSKVHSTEVIDFLLYLTPGDVWRGEVYNKEGQAWIKSDDDSIHNLPNATAWANAERADVALFDRSMLAKDEDDINEVGHIEFIGHYSAVGSVNTTSGPINIFRTMSKDSLKALFDMPVLGFGDGITDLNLDLCPLDDGSGIMYEGLSAPTCPVRIDNPEGLRLRGNVEIHNSDGRVAYEMTALSSSRVFNRNLAPVGATSFSNVIRAATDNSSYILKSDNLATNQEIAGTHVIANTYLEINIATETPIGIQWGYTRGEIALSPHVIGNTVGDYDNILEIERALAATKVNGAYEADNADPTKVQVTFPTKYRHRGRDICAGGTGVSGYSAPFNLSGHVAYSVLSLDDYENAPLTGCIDGVNGTHYWSPEKQNWCTPPGGSVSGGDEPDAPPPPPVRFIFDEVNMLPDDVGESAEYFFAFAKGQYQLNLQAQGGCEVWYQGVPTIAHTYKYTTDGSMNPMMIPASTDKWQWQIGRASCRERV